MTEKAREERAEPPFGTLRAAGASLTAAASEWADLWAPHVVDPPMPARLAVAGWGRVALEVRSAGRGVPGSASGARYANDQREPEGEAAALVGDDQARYGLAGRCRGQGGHGAGQLYGPAAFPAQARRVWARGRVARRPTGTYGHVHACSVCL